MFSDSHSNYKGVTSTASGGKSIPQMDGNGSFESHLSIVLALNLHLNAYIQFQVQVKDNWEPSKQFPNIHIAANRRLWEFSQGNFVQK